MTSAQGKNLDLQREVRWHEEQRLKEYDRLEAVQCLRHRGDALRSAESPAPDTRVDGAARATLGRHPVPHVVPAEAGDDPDHAGGTDSEDDEDDQELASYSRIHGLSTPPWPSVQPGPSLQRQKWGEARNNVAAAQDSARLGPPFRASGATAAGKPVDESCWSTGAARKARASVSWDVPPHVSEAINDGDASGELDASWGQHDKSDQHAEVLRASGHQWTATVSDQYDRTLGWYGKLQHDSHVSTGWQADGGLQPTRSVSPSQVPSHRPVDLKQGRPSHRHAGPLRSGVQDSGTADSEQRFETADTCALGSTHRAAGQWKDADSRNFWRRFAADDNQRGDEAVSGSGVAGARRASMWRRGTQGRVWRIARPALMPTVHPALGLLRGRTGVPETKLLVQRWAPRPFINQRLLALLDPHDLPGLYKLDSEAFDQQELDWRPQAVPRASATGCRIERAAD